MADTLHLGAVKQAALGGFVGHHEEDEIEAGGRGRCQLHLLL